MDVVTVAGDYRRISEEIGCKVHVDLVECLEKTPHELNLSRYVYSSKFFECVIHVLERRSEIEVLDISGMQIPAAQLVRLFTVLRGGSVAQLSLCDVPLDSVSGGALKELVMECEGLRVVKLSNTGLPGDFEYAVMLQTEINRMQWEVNQRLYKKAVRPEAPKVRRWCLESWGGDLCVRVPGYFSDTNVVSCRDIMERALKCSTPFTDECFTPSVALGRSMVTWKRISSLLRSEEHYNRCCIGGELLLPSVINDTSNLRAALTIVQQVPHLLKYLCIWKLPCIGAFAFRMFRGGSPVEVVIDDFIPMVNEAPGGIHHPDNTRDYWGCLVEKAFAKLHGGYENITAVSFGYALSCLTGGVCFEAETGKFGENVYQSEMFHFLRDCVHRKRVVAFYATPKGENSLKYLNELGIVPFMPYCVTNVDTRCIGCSGSSYLLQFSSVDDHVTGDFTLCMSRQSDCSSQTTLKWMYLVDALSCFDRIVALLWPHGDPLFVRRYVVEHTCCCRGGSDSDSTFACNPSFLLENPSNCEKEVMLVMKSCEENKDDFDQWLQIHVFRVGDVNAKVVRRCDICPTNVLFATKKVKGREVGLAVLLKGNEFLQVTVSASSGCSCSLSATCIDCFNFSPLSIPFVKTIEGLFDSFPKSNQVIILRNNNDRVLSSLIVAISQKPNSKRTVGVGLEMWNICGSSLTDENLVCITEYRSNILVVFKLDVMVKPQGSFKLVVRARCVRDVVEFSLTIFSDASLE